MPARTRVKVSRTQLIESIKARKAEAYAEYVKKYQVWESKKVNLARVVRDKLRETTAKLRADGTKGLKFSSEWVSNRNGGRNYEKTLQIRLGIPAEQDKPVFNSGRFDRDIRLLEMGTDDTISLSAEDFERYIK